MATITWTADRNASMDGSTVGLTETNTSGKTMTTGLEINVDKAKIKDPQEVVELLDKLKKLILESVVMNG